MLAQKAARISVGPSGSDLFSDPSGALLLVGSSGSMAVQQAATSLHVCNRQSAQIYGAGCLLA